MRRGAALLVLLGALPVYADGLRASFIDGPGVGRTLELEGKQATVEQAHAEEGGAVGLFRAPLAAGDDALVRDARKVKGTGARPDSPSVRLEVRGPGAPPSVVVGLPADAATGEFLGRLEAVYSRALEHPFAAVKLTAAPQAGKPLRIQVKVVNAGTSPVRVGFAERAKVESAKPMPPPKKGVTPLPPEWTDLTTVELPKEPVALAPGAEWTTTVEARPTGKIGGVRVTYEGPLTLAEPTGEPHRLAASLSSAPSTTRK
jgi:hypothetical protein